jgi:hypothetical protein
VCWKRRYHHHSRRSLLQYPHEAFRVEILYGRIRPDSRRDDKVCRSQLQGGVRLQEGRSLFGLRQIMATIYPQTGSTTPDLSSSPASSTSQAISLLYGTSIGKALLQVTCGPDPDAMHTSKDAESWKAEVVFTNASYQAKKFIFLLFINRKPNTLKIDRLVLKVVLKTVSLSPREYDGQWRQYTQVSSPKGSFLSCTSGGGSASSDETGVDGCPTQSRNRSPVCGRERSSDKARGALFERRSHRGTSVQRRSGEVTCQEPV